MPMQKETQLLIKSINFNSMQRILSFLLVISITATLASCTARTEPIRKIQSDLIPVKTIPLEQTNSTATVNVSGQFTTDDEVLLSFKTGGIIERIFVKEGDAIHKGQLLATLNLTEINASVQQARISYDKAVRDHQRLIQLFNDSVATLEQVQNAKTTMDLASQQLNSAEFNRHYSEIRAEANGFVLRKMANEGQQVSSGNAVFQTNGAGSGKWILRSGVTDKQWAAIKLGDAAEIGMAAGNGQTIAGKVTRKSEAADQANGLFTIDITVAGNHQGKIATGMFGSGVITTGAGNSHAKQKTEGWSVPYDALLDEDGSTGFVFVTSDNKTANKIKVTISGIEKDRVIISEGLESAGSLIISGSAYLTDHSPISIQN
jgi:RND family efflux transporter MFP subunit